MYIEVQFAGGTIGRYPLTDTSTIAISDPSFPTNTFAAQGVESIELVHADLTPDTPVPDETVGTVGGKPDGDVEPTQTDSSVTSSVTDSDGNTTTTVSAPTDAADQPAPPEGEPAPVVDPTPIVNTATDAVNDPTVPAEDALSVVKAAQADIQQALATAPDSAPLLDAANQLSQLEADLTPPA